MLKIKYVNGEMAVEVNGMGSEIVEELTKCVVVVLNKLTNESGASYDDVYDSFCVNLALESGLSRLDDIIKKILSVDDILNEEV